MRHGLAVVLLVVAVVGAVVAAVAAAGVGRARRRRPWSRSLAGVVDACTTRATTLRPLGGAARVRARRRCRSRSCSTRSGSSRSSPAGPRAAAQVVGACWILAAAVVALLNLDAAVVLLTPLYVRTARRVGVDPVMLAFQPVLLAMLASGVLPVSNLTNLIAASHLSLTSTDFLAHLALPSVLASTVGWFAYRRVFPARAVIARSSRRHRPARAGGRWERDRAVPRAARRRRARRVPAWVAALVTIGFLVAVHAAMCRGAGCRSARSCSPPRSRSSPQASAAAFPHLFASVGDGGCAGSAPACCRPTCSTICRPRS